MNQPATDKTATLPATSAAEAHEDSLIDEVLRQTPQIPSPKFAIPRNWEEVEALAKRICDAGWCPKSHIKDNTPNQASVELAILQGMELGVPPLMAVQGIAIINGVPAIWGDLMLAVVSASGLLEAKAETIDGDGEELRATCRVKRLGRPNQCTRTFTWQMAKHAQLASKAGPWKLYPTRMMMMRARSWALRDEFADVLRGMASMEELRDSGALARAIEATEEAAKAGSTAASITADLKGAQDLPPDKQPPSNGEAKNNMPTDDDPPASSEDEKSDVADGPAPTGDLLGPTEAEWMDAAQAMIARIDDADSVADLDVIAASGHVKPELDRMATAAPQQHAAVTGFIAEKRKGLER